MKKFLSISTLALAAAMPNASYGQYQLSGKSYESSWSKGSWDGSVAFPGVFCIKMPSAADATYMDQAMFNNNAIYLARIAYPDNTILAVATSTVPAGRSPQEEMGKLMASNQTARTHLLSSGSRYDISETTTDFGSTLGLTLTNITQGNKEGGPFPLARQFAVPKDGGPPRSMSVHRLFVRGPDRFEIAALKLAAKPFSKEEESALESRLNAMADDTVRALQQCTAQIPLRTPRS